MCSETLREGGLKESCDGAEPPSYCVWVSLTWFCLVDQRQSNAAILTANCRESPSTGDAQHVQPEHTAWREGTHGPYIHSAQHMLTYFYASIMLVIWDFRCLYPLCQLVYLFVLVLSSCDAFITSCDSMRVRARVSMAKCCPGDTDCSRKYTVKLPFLKWKVEKRLDCIKQESHEAD